MKILNWIKKIILSRLFICVVVFVLQLALLYAITTGARKVPVINLITGIFDFLLIIYVISLKENPAYKLVWSILIYVIPVFGGIVYLMFSQKRIPKPIREEIAYSLKKSEGILTRNGKYEEALKDEDIKQQFNYVSNNALYPYYQNTKCKYFDSAEDAFEDVLNNIKKAKNFIFLEFFIVKEGFMLDKILEELLKKVNDGVEVYLMYDDAGSINSVPANFVKKINKLGIHCVEFSKVSVRLSLVSKTNNRDHRKIIVIDNKYAYVGGFNIGDEYINKEIRFGHWKDSGIRLEGEAVSNLTIMFIQLFNAMATKTIKYQNYLLASPNIKNDSFVLPFSDSPGDHENVGRAVHLNLINHAKKYIYISTPYLITDYDINHALINAAKCGVEVIINVPHIPDKKSVFMVTRSNYDVLINNGVKIYEYTPGFLHSKNIIVDDKIALVGSINMDFRSYYLNYESAVLIAFDKEIIKIKKDYLQTISLSNEVTEDDLKNVNIFVKIVQNIMGLLSPLL